MYKYALFNNATLCMRAPLFKQMAQSTAFRIPDYDLVSNPKNYSLWTESGKISLPKPLKSSIKTLSEWAYLTQSRIYLVESPVKQNVSLSLGIISLFFAFLIAWTMKWKVSHFLVRITSYYVLGILNLRFGWWYNQSCFCHWFVIIRVVIIDGHFL